MFSPSSNERYKYEGNEHLYPFSISKEQYKAVEHAINSSSKYIPAGTFSGSFAGQSFDNQKGNYRSVDWISWLVHIVPLLIAPFCPPDCKDAISALCHGLQVSLQWCITPEDLYDIKTSFSTWFNYLNKCLVQKMISRTVFRANMHLLLHVPSIIRRMGPLRCLSLRSMERGIGKLKRVMKGSKLVGISAGNILETKAIFNYLELSGMVTFEKEEKERSALAKPIYLEHPLEEGLPQLWGPFASSYNTEELRQEIDLGKSKIAGYVTGTWALAMLNYIARRESCPTPSFPLHFFGQEMIIAPKLWCDNTVYSSDLSMRSNKNTTKKGEYIMFSATRRNALKKVETRYYFARVLFFFSFQYNSDGPGSHFCFAELAQSQEAAYFNTAIPTVSFVKVGTRDHVIFDACDIETLVGLVYRPKRDVLTELSSHQMPDELSGICSPV
ncbi:hypothetical protein BD770DRAFT_450216 [Pilaira anomala]|nr:hypothetical protein BD770DRAFT_450216 [Pilaira anomala]